MLEALEGLVDVVGGLEGVAAGELEDAEGDGVVSVHVGLAPVVARADLDAGDVGEFDDVAVVAGLEDDLAELGGGLEASGSGEGVLELGAFGSGGLAEEPAATWTFCSRTASRMSPAVRSRAAIFSGSSQRRME